MNIRESKPLSGILFVCKFNIFIDPIIYVLLYPVTRKHLMQIVRKIFVSERAHDLRGQQQETAVPNST